MVSLLWFGLHHYKNLRCVLVNILLLFVRVEVNFCTAKIIYDQSAAVHTAVLPYKKYSIIIKMLQSDWITLPRSWRARAICSVWHWQPAAKVRKSSKKVSSCLSILLCFCFLIFKSTMVGRTPNSFYKHGNLYREQRNRSCQRLQYRRDSSCSTALPFQPRETLFERPEREIES